MKKYILPLLLLLSFSLTAQQVNYNITGTVNKKITVLGASGSELEKGTKVTVTSFYADPVYGSCLILSSGESQLKIARSDLKRIDLNFPTTKEELWQVLRINSDLDASLLKKGYQYELRKDLEDDASDALQNFEKLYGFYYDEYLDDYLHSLLYRIHPLTLNDGRPGNLTVKILKTCNPNAFSMSTGTIVLTTGLLSIIRSEDELIAVLAHEVAHFELDHQVVNINKAVTRQKRAEFWSGIATIAAAASEEYLARKYDYIPSGNLTFATAILSSSIASSINERLGANYSADQDFEADNAAVATLTFMKKNPFALSAALIRIGDYCRKNGDYVSVSPAGIYPNLSGRIVKMGNVDVSTLNSLKYDRTISFVNTYNAVSEYGLQHLSSAIGLADRNLDAGVATEDDYVIKAMATRLLYDTPEKNQEAIDLLNKAKTLNIVPRNYIFKQEGITLLRMGKQKEAVEAFTTYLKNMEGQGSSDALIDEVEWARKMIYKLGQN